jgi:undecaprenyl-diphosphatase
VNDLIREELDYLKGRSELSMADRDRLEHQAIRDVEDGMIGMGLQCSEDGLDSQAIAPRLRVAHASCFLAGMASSTRIALLLSASALSTLAYLLVSDEVRRKKTRRVDRTMRSKTPQPSKSADPVGHAAAMATGPLGKWYGHLPAALGTAWNFHRRRRTAAALAVAGTSLGAIVLSRVLDRVMAHHEPPPGRTEPGKQSYPSGHALETTAVSIVSGYALLREGLATPFVTLPLATASVASGLGRLALDRHWASDLVGGYCAGIAFGTACAGFYEWRRAAA